MEVLVVIGVLGLFFLLMSVRLIFVKGGFFRGTCASQSPFLQDEGGSCSYCGRNLEEGEVCKRKEEKEAKKAKAKF